MLRFSGIINHIAFKKGDNVKEGDLLFQLTIALLLPFLLVWRHKFSVQSRIGQAKSEAKRAIRLTTQKAISKVPRFYTNVKHR
jgi:multidrug efflux system membrane fusion protein